MVEAITYIAARLLRLVELREPLENHLISAVYRLSTTLAKFLFVAVSRNRWIPLLLPFLRSLYAMLVGLRSTRGSSDTLCYHLASLFRLERPSVGVGDSSNN